MNKKLKLFAISHNFNIEGASIFMFELMVELVKRGNVAVTVLSLCDGPLRDRYVEAGIKVESLPFAEDIVRSSKYIEESIAQLSHFFSSKKYDLIYVNTVLGYPAIHSAYSINVPIIWNIHESQSEEFWWSYLGDRYKLAQKAFEYSSEVVFVAEATRKLWQDRGYVVSSRCIHNALNDDSFRKKRTGLTRKGWRKSHGISVDAVVFLCVGTFHERKGQLDLLAAVSRWSIEERAPVVLCVGDSGGEYSDALHGFREMLPSRIRERIVFLPKLENICDAYSFSDVFVCCSRNESYPLVILEALACRLPIISTPVFGISEQLQFGVNALKYSPGDVDKLCEHMELLFVSKHTRERFSDAAAIRYSELGTFEKMVCYYEQMFNEVIVRQQH